MNKAFVNDVSEQSETGFVLAIHNTLLGVFNYLVLNLPPKWRLKSGDIPSEMSSSTKIGEVRWVREGVSVNYVYQDENALRLVVNIREKMKPSKLVLRGILYDKIVNVNGHQGRAVAGRVTRGLRRKKHLEYLRFEFYCHVTNRSIELSLEGRCAENSLIALGEAIQRSTCH